MKLVNKIINGNNFSTLAAHADIAVATLSEEIKLSDAIFPICLPHDKSSSSMIVGEFSGWSWRLKATKKFNASFTQNKINPIHEVRPDELMEFAEG